MLKVDGGQIIVLKPFNARFGDGNAGSSVHRALTQCCKSWLRVRPVNVNFFSKNKICSMKVLVEWFFLNIISNRRITLKWKYPHSSSVMEVSMSPKYFATFIIWKHYWLIFKVLLQKSNLYNLETLLKK